MDKEPGSRKDWFGRYSDGFRYTRPAFVLMIMYENHECFMNVFLSLNVFPLNPRAPIGFRERYIWAFFFSSIAGDHIAYPSQGYSL